jgi:hypothetical protein
MVMMNQIVELLSHLVTLRFAARMPIEMMNALATTEEMNANTTSQPSDIIDFPFDQVAHLLQSLTNSTAANCGFSALALSPTYIL